MKNLFRLRLMWLFMLFCMIPLWALSQNITVKGIVKDGAGESVIGASVLQKGTTNGTITDFEGGFTLNLPSNSVIVVSFVGYKTQEISVAGKTDLTVTLTEDTQLLGNVVVVGYGTQKKEDLTSAIATLSPKEVLKSPGGITDALQGSTAGVNVSGEKIRIRGTGSITGSTDPLWVVDGIIDASGNIPNDDEIESIQVLKDAASCAIYGVRGANGVIVVTTKKGAEGKPKISFNAYAGFGTPSKKVDMMNAYDYGVYVNELYYNSSDAAQIANGTWNTTVPSGVSTPSKPMANTDWWDEYFCNTNYQKYDVSISGGGQYANYRIGATHTDNDDQMHKNDAKVDNIYANVEGTVGRFTYGGRVFANYSRTNGYNGASLMNTLITPPNLPVYNEDGTFFLTGNSGRDGNDIHNQIWYLHNQEFRNRSVSAMGSIFGELKIFDWLKYRLTYTYSYARNNDASIVPEYDLGTTNGRQAYNSQTLTYGGSGHEVIENLLTFDKTFNDVHSLSGVLGMVSEKFDGWSTGVSGRSNEYSGFGIATRYPDSQIVTGSQYNEAYFSYLARVMYSYNSKYMITANFRADESSKFIDGNRWGYFPSVSAGWVVSQEEFMKPLTQNGALTFLKLRGSWGVNGNIDSLGGFAYASTLWLGGNNYSFSDKLITGASPSSQLANADLCWERSTQLDFGLEARFLRDRLQFGLDWYRKETTDMLSSISAPAVSGASYQYINAGKILNRGLDLELKWQDHIGDFNYSVGGNISFLHNEVLESPYGDGRYAGGGGMMTEATYFEVGYPIWYLRTYVVDHIDQLTGEPIYKTAEELGTDDGKAEVGSYIPDFTYGLNLSLGWKNWDLNVQGYGAAGAQTFLAVARVESNTLLGNLPKALVNDYWSWTNTDGSRPSPKTWANSSSMYYYGSSDHMVFNSSYFKIKNIQLGYTFPQKWIRPLHLSALRLYGSLENFFIFTNYPGNDPESMASMVSGERNSLGMSAWGGIGTDRIQYPTMKQIVFGLNVSF